MNWRPKGWKNPYREEDWQEQEKEIFENGADAMLKALREMGGDPKKMLGLNNLFQNHRVVFIPNEEKK